MKNKTDSKEMSGAGSARGLRGREYMVVELVPVRNHHKIESRTNLVSISHRCHLFVVAFVWELTKETIELPLGCLQGGERTFLSPGRFR